MVESDLFRPSEQQGGPYPVASFDDRNVERGETIVIPTVGAGSAQQQVGSKLLMPTPASFGEDRDSSSCAQGPQSSRSFAPTTTKRLWLQRCDRAWLPYMEPTSPRCNIPRSYPAELQLEAGQIQQSVSTFPPTTAPHEAECGRDSPSIQHSHQPRPRTAC